MQFKYSIAVVNFVVFVKNILTQQNFFYDSCHFISFGRKLYIGYRKVLPKF